MILRALHHMAMHIPFDNNWLSQITQNPDQEFSSSSGAIHYSANIAIPYFRKNIENHFKDTINLSLQQECNSVGIVNMFEHFGLVIKFTSATEISPYNDQGVLHDGLCDIMATVGPVIIKNAYLEPSVRDDGHRNRFPQLQFHIDRSAKQEARYSFYSRNPFDEEQKHPRTASTLFTSNIAAYLQAIKQKTIQRSENKWPITSSLLFENEDMDNVFGNVVLRQAWDEPEGTGEVAMIDNATVLHASYYTDAQRSGYKIGVRYLGGK